MAHDQITLQGSPSTQHLDASDAETEVDDQVAELKKDPKGLDIIYHKGKQVVRQPQVEENLICLEASLLDTEIQEHVSPSPALEDLKLLESRHEPGQLSPSPQVASSNSSMIEKRDSAQSTTFKTPSVVVRRESEASIHSHHSNNSQHRKSDALSPLAWEFNGFDRSASNGSSQAARSTRAESIQSIFPEVVPEAIDPFPKVLNPPPFLPMSAEDQQINLLRRRYTIVTADEQLQWAEEALHYVSITSRQRERVSRTQSKPTEASNEELELEKEAKLLVRLHLPTGHRKALFLQASYFGLDPTTTLELFKTSLGNGYARSAFYIANMLEANPKMRKSTVLGYYKEGAASNDSACNYVCTTYRYVKSELTFAQRLGEAYLSGELGLKKEVKDAIWYLRKAAEMPDRDFPQALFVSLHTIT
jgi:TPR repeat protein